MVAGVSTGSVTCLRLALSPLRELPRPPAPTAGWLRLRPVAPCETLDSSPARQSRSGQSRAVGHLPGPKRSPFGRARHRGPTQARLPPRGRAAKLPGAGCSRGETAWTHRATCPGKLAASGGREYCVTGPRSARALPASNAAACLFSQFPSCLIPSRHLHRGAIT
jgi:hypothetical protein